MVWGKWQQSGGYSATVRDVYKRQVQIKALTTVPGREITKARPIMIAASLTVLILSLIHI